MKESRFKLEPASGNEAGFIVSSKLKAKILNFRTIKELDSYTPKNKGVQIRRNIPIFLEIIESKCNTESQERVELKYMARWYFYMVLKAPNN